MQIYDLRSMGVAVASCFRFIFSGMRYEVLNPEPKTPHLILSTPHRVLPTLDRVRYTHRRVHYPHCLVRYLAYPACAHHPISADMHTLCVRFASASSSRVCATRSPTPNPEGMTRSSENAHPLRTLGIDLR